MRECGTKAGGRMSCFRSRKGDRKRTQKDPEIMHLLAEEQQLYARGNHSTALPVFQQALEFAHTRGDRAAEGTALNNLGMVYRGQGQFEKALIQLVLL